MLRELALPISPNHLSQMAETTYQPAEGRYDAMHYRRCGASGLLLPALSLGCWHNFGAAGTGANRIAEETQWHENCRRMLVTAFDLGITHFDLANNYGPPPGAAEERVGRIVRELPRDELILSSKAGYRMWPGPYGDGGSRKYLLASLDQSLRRLGVEYVDIFYSHRFDKDTPLEETLQALDHAVRSGKALCAGISSYSGAQTADAVRLCEQGGWVRPIIHQPNYSMLNRRIEGDLLPATRRLGLGVICFGPLRQGLLTDKYLRGGIPEDSRAASEHGALKPESITPDVVETLRRLNALAGQRGQSLSQMALAWALRDEAVTSALIGASRPEQIEQNVAALAAMDFSDEELRQIDAILEGPARDAPNTSR
jgi:L-glyceraldehyde 3-phosphate reductase